MNTLKIKLAENNFKLSVLMKDVILFEHFFKKVIMSLIMLNVYLVDAQQFETDDDVIAIANKVFQQKKETHKYQQRVMFVDIFQNKSTYDFITLKMNSGDLKVQFLKDLCLYEKLFNEDELNNYKKQILDEKYMFNHCSIETDSIFVYNKVRDHHQYRGNRLRIVNENSVESISKPLFTLNNKYAILTVGFAGGGGFISIFNKKDHIWVQIKEIYISHS